MDDNYSEGRRGGKRAVLAIIALLLLVGLAAYALSNNKSDDNVTNQSETSQTGQQDAADEETDDGDASSAQAKFAAAFPEEQRTVYYNADTAVQENPSATDANLDEITAYYKSNEGTELLINGSVFTNNTEEEGNPLALQRANQIKQELLDRGVAEEDISITAGNTYEGNDDAARARYARSVTINAE